MGRSLIGGLALIQILLIGPSESLPGRSQDTTMQHSLLGMSLAEAGISVIRINGNTKKVNDREVQATPHAWQMGTIFTIVGDRHPFPNVSGSFWKCSIDILFPFFIARRIVKVRRYSAYLRYSRRQGRPDRLLLESSPASKCWTACHFARHPGLFRRSVSLPPPKY